MTTATLQRVLAAPRVRRKQHASTSARPLIATLLVLSILTVCSSVFSSSSVARLLGAESPSSRDSGIHIRVAGDGALLSARAMAASQPDCREVHHAANKCDFVLAYCLDDEAGLLPYLTFYYCTLGGSAAQPVAFVLMACWLGLLFTTIGIAASDFFSVNLSTIASILGLSESLAGVTFLAFGNGSPDVFSTFAAMGSNSGSMAIGELIGAAGFITAVVAGSMALVREFRVSRKTFVRDVCFFITAVAFSMAFLSDGHLHLWECCVMIGFYVFYVFTVVGWHWVSRRRRYRRAREAASRSHVYGAEPTEMLEPYRDEEGEDEEEDTQVGVGSHGRSGSGTAAPDISLLEIQAAPGIEIEDDDEEDEDTRRHIQAEMTNSMRVLRPRGRRSTTTITPIRPSLVGALEFRSVLASLQKGSHVKLNQIHSRSHSENNFDGLDSLVEPGAGGSGPSAVPRDRALSSGEAQLGLQSMQNGSGDSVPRSSTDDATDDFLRPARSNTSPAGVEGGRGAVMPSLGPSIRTGQTQGATTMLHDRSLKPGNRPSPNLLQVQIPSPHGSGRSSPSLSPFPGFSESPLPMSPDLGPQQHLVHRGSIDLRRARFSDLARHDDEPKPRPLKWWPYQLLPDPHLVASTIFPGLYDWDKKNWLDKVVGVISLPSVFLLMVTLPVVDVEKKDDDESDDGIVDRPQEGRIGHMEHAVAHETHGSIQREQTETEWQRYRRSTRSRSRESFPLLLEEPEGSATVHPSPNLSIPANDQVGGKPVTSVVSSDETTDGATDDTQDWNRWLVFIQIFLGPQFAAFIVWANLREDLAEPRKTLLRFVLWALLASLVALALLLLTTVPDKRPKHHYLLCFLGFVISVAWISTVAGEVVGVLKAFGVILNISEAILGLTVFAVGNSLGDLVADVTVARLGYSNMAL